ncbi:MAG: hypothetical protein U0003_05480 [Vampirovibrionales bacterium]
MLALTNNTVFPVLSTLVLVLIALGLKHRRVPGKHIPLMLSALLIDVGMVLWLEWHRQAVEQVVEGVSGLLLFHVCVSTLVVVLYIGLLITGIRQAKGIALSTQWHRWMAIAFVVGRLINYVTSFFVGSA